VEDGKNAFLSTLQPHTLSTTYALPSDNQLGNGSAMSDDAVRARRVQEQIKMKLAEKGTLPRQNGKAFQYAMSEMYSGGFQGSIKQNQMDRDDISVHSLRNMQTVNPWLIDNSDAGSLISERDGPFDQQYSQSAMNGYGTQIRQGGGTITYQTGFQTQEPVLTTSRRSISGTLSRGGGLGGGGTEIIQQQSFKGPAHRTINRIANRNRMSVSSTSGSRMTSSSGNIGAGGDRMDGGFLMSVRSGSQGNIYQQRQGGMILDTPTAVSYLEEDDTALQVLGSAYIQHICYNEETAKDKVRDLGATKVLVKLFNSDDPEVRRYSTGAIRNMIYQHVANKQDLIDNNGIKALDEALEMEDDELRKNITGILWNLSAKDPLKEKLKTILPRLTEKVLIPVSTSESTKAEMIKEDKGIPSNSPSETEILHNTLGCLRNLSSGSEKVRKEVRETKGLVESLVNFLRSTLDTGKVQEKGAENATCILRNLSYQLYDEMPPSMKSNLSYEGTNTSSNTVGCFSPNSRKIKQTFCCTPDMLSFSPAELSKMPKGLEWLWHPKIVHLYNSVIKSCEINATTREAAIGALQNITAGQEPWAERMSRYMVNDYKMLPNLMDLLRSERSSELRSLSGLFRSLSSHADSQSTIDVVVRKLPEDVDKDMPGSEVLVNLCGVLNNMVARNFEAAKRITENSGLARLMNMKRMAENEYVTCYLTLQIQFKFILSELDVYAEYCICVNIFHSCNMLTLDEMFSRPAMADVSRSASIVLRNIYNYRKLHKTLRQVRDFKNNKKCSSSA
uniref:Plakophilin 3 n=1 Tax=Xiphophorus couchianus TaxID=32473 RepID=A0A3B5MDX7_9TELE